MIVREKQVGRSEMADRINAGAKFVKEEQDKRMKERYKLSRYYIKAIERGYELAHRDKEKSERRENESVN